MCNVFQVCKTAFLKIQKYGRYRKYNYVINLEFAYKPEKSNNYMLNDICQYVLIFSKLFLITFKIYSTERNFVG